MGKGTSEAYKLVRSKIDFMENDRIFYKDQKLAADLIHEGTLVASVEKVIGEIN